MEEEPHALLVGVAIEVVDAVGVEAGRAADESVDLVAAVEQLLGEVGTVLAGDAGDKGAGHGAMLQARREVNAASHPTQGGPVFADLDLLGQGSTGGSSVL
jgi:hypothetical protein